MSRPERPASVPLPAQLVHYDGHAGAGATREVPVETPVNIVYNDAPFAVMMATPHDLEDFAWGFSLTEGIIGSVHDVVRVELRTQPQGLELRVTLAPGIGPGSLGRTRSTAGRTGCGVCGIDQLDALPLTPVRARPAVIVDPAAIHRALLALEPAQLLNHRTHAVHAAAWCTADGALVAVREDVGRHNALDKLIGALLRAGHAADDGFLVITSRCSFEMVEKAAAYGAATIVAISAPTSLAVERATLHGMTLLAVARHDSALAFTGAERVQPLTMAGETAT